MQGFKAKFRVAALVFISIWLGLAALYGLIKPISNGCVMTYMYPTYIPISSPANVSSAKYGLYLYHEGWQKIDFNEHLKKLSGVPVLFIPGNGGSYEQVRSLAAESDRAYQGGPLERSFYQEASLTLEEGGVNMDMAGFSLPNQYSCVLDWFAVDLEGEHSAMDGRILEEHTNYVVYAIHRILDQYKESRDAQIREGASISGNLPKSVILVGHSMGGFVARAANVHPHLRKSAVETVLTLSSPHQSPPVALQPSLGHYYSHVNREWRKGYEVQTSRTGQYVSGPLLSHVVIVSITGGIADYQVRSKLESLDGIVPPTHGFMISSTGMKNVWLSMEHQVILWCNQLVVQVSHTLLSLIDSETGQPFSDTQKRLVIFAKMLRSGIPQSFNWLSQSQSSQRSPHLPIQDGKDVTGVTVSKVTPCFCNSFFTASFCSHARKKELSDSKQERGNGSDQIAHRYGGGFNKHLPSDENCSSSPDSARSFGDTQLEIFHHRHGLLILHFLATLMFAPSLMAWLQRIGMSQSFPWFVDSALCIGVILHVICDSKPEFNFFLFPFPGIPAWEIRLSSAYLLAGYYSFLSGLALAPCRAFYAMAAIGIISFAFRIIQRRNREKGEARFSSRKHYHRH